MIVYIVNGYDASGRLQAIASPVTATGFDGTSFTTLYPAVQYIWGPDRVLAKTDKLSGKSYYYLYNGHGDVVQIVDTSGNVVNSYDYDIWGNFITKTESIENHFTYFCQTYDETTGLYYLRARYYDPTTGRFTQQDTAEDGYNWYIYGNQNPVRYVDPSGYEYIPLRKTAENLGFKIYFDSESKKATLNTGVDFFPGDGKGTFISSSGTMYIWQNSNDSSIFFAEGNDSVSNEGWIITAAAVGIAVGIKGGANLRRLSSLFGKSTSIATTATLGAQKAIENLNNYTVKSKHIIGSSGDWAKFSTQDTRQINDWIYAALKNSTLFVSNSEDSFYAIYELGQQIGTRGEQAIKVVFTEAGKIITAFPVK